LNSPLGHVEFLLYATGNSHTKGTQTISIQVALQHPFSHGRLYIATNDPFDPPVIDPQYFSHSADVIMFRQGLKLARKIAQTPPLSDVLTEEVAPGPDVKSDKQWEEFAANTIGTEYHPANTLAMLPKDQGGVVDAKLRVYGLANVRAADSSVFPIQFAAHLQWPVFALAEQASTIIRDFYAGVPAPGDSTSTTDTSTPTQQPSNGAASSFAATNLFVSIVAFSLALFVSL